MVRQLLEYFYAFAVNKDGQLIIKYNKRFLEQTKSEFALYKFIFVKGYNYDNEIIF